MRYPEAAWEPVSYGDGGAYTSGPARIVLHTTENSDTAGADAELHRHFASHFVCGADRVIQLIGTDRASMALQHTGDPQTNRMGACIQIEMVGFAGRRKNPAMLANARKLCAWIVEQYRIPLAWPNGYCVPAIGGQDSNHHNRNPLIWATHGGFYGHEHVPENFHWDPALELDELLLVTGLTEQPPAPPAPSEYVVQPGDTVYRIAIRHALTPGALEAMNGLTAPFEIQVGEKLRVVA